MDRGPTEFKPLASREPVSKLAATTPHGRKQPLSTKESTLCRPRHPPWVARDPQKLGPQDHPNRGDRAWECYHIAMSRSSLAVFPGTFDPFTLGHLDLCARGLRLFSKVVVTVGKHHAKGHLFDPESRLAMIQACTAHLEGVEVRWMEGLLVDGCREFGASAILRGVRTAADLDYERQMALTNRAMMPEVETVLLLSAPEHSHISSTLVRQIAKMGGDVSSFVPPAVLKSLESLPNR